MDTTKTNIDNILVTPSREIELKLLALDLDTCTRCVGTLDNIETAIEKVKSVLEATGTEINVHKILIESAEEAEAHRFISSPAIRINDQDIVFETLESECDSCTDLCGCEEVTSCRVWKYQGQKHTEAPVGLVVESLMVEIFGSSQERAPKTDKYEGVPKNLQRFFAGKAEKKSTKVAECCSTQKQESCCEPSEKEACCQTETEESGSCGCQ